MSLLQKLIPMEKTSFFVGYYLVEVTHPKTFTGYLAIAGCFVVTLGLILWIKGMM